MRSALNSLFLVATALLLGGCRTTHLHGPAGGDAFKPSNVHRSAETLPVTLRRVAVLPLAPAGDRPGLDGGASIIGPLIGPELVASGLVEAVEVSASEISRWTGRAKLRLTQELPAGALEAIRRQTACDAVLFSELTQFSAFPPLSVGLRLSLVDVQSGRVIWSVDEILDAGNPPVATGARRFFQTALKGSGSTPFDAESVLDSPNRFGRYVVATLVATMPKR